MSIIYVHKNFDTAFAYSPLLDLSADYVVCPMWN